METPKQIYKKMEEPVDVDNFTFSGKFKWLVVNAETHQRHGFESLFNFLLYFSVGFVVFRIVRTPIEWYYDFKDPLLQDES
jgi:hypothetical protein